MTPDLMTTEIQAPQKSPKLRSFHGEGALRNRTPEYRTWVNMRNRCSNRANKDYRYYGGRGIVVCERWRNYPNFLADMGRRPGPNFTIERADNDGPYSPENCTWATRAAQGANNRKVKLIQFGGASRSISEWARMFGVKATTLAKRLRSGWSAEKAILTAIKS